ncbi:MAG: hypothetical protein IT430_09880 [Phycisphaerales bacterium]|nr:hypothetical protein [Phycisphaerales bacterium]
MPFHLKSNFWNGEGVQIFDGAAAGTNIGITAEVTIERVYTLSPIKGQTTGETILGHRVTGCFYRVTVDFTEIGEANHFLNYWFDGHAAAGGVIDLHPGRSFTLPTRRMRFHPVSMAADTTRDFVFEALAPVSGPSATFNGSGEHRHRVVFESMPVEADLPTLNAGKFNYVPA